MLRRLYRRPEPQSLEVTDEGVTRRLGDGRVEAVRWDALTEVVIDTSSSGPFEEDVFFVLVETPESGCLVPNSLMTEELLSRITALPGFDHEQMIAAMGSATDARFVCWKRGG